MCCYLSRESQPGFKVGTSYSLLELSRFRVSLRRIYYTKPRSIIFVACLLLYKGNDTFIVALATLHEQRQNEN